VSASDQLRAAARARGSASAIAATLGSLDASLEALGDAVGMLGEETDRLARLNAVSVGEHRLSVDELHTRLLLAQLAAGEMRERLGPLVAQLTLAPTPNRR
jgi:hypothetical protein